MPSTGKNMTLHLVNTPVCDDIYGFHLSKLMYDVIIYVQVYSYFILVNEKHRANAKGDKL